MASQSLFELCFIAVRSRVSSPLPHTASLGGAVDLGPPLFLFFFLLLLFLLLLLPLPPLPAAFLEETDVDMVATCGMVVCLAWRGVTF